MEVTGRALSRSEPRRPPDRVDVHSLCVCPAAFKSVARTAHSAAQGARAPYALRLPRLREGHHRCVWLEAALPSALCECVLRVRHRTRLAEPHNETDTTLDTSSLDPGLSLRPRASTSGMPSYHSAESRRLASRTHRRGSNWQTLGSPAFARGKQWSNRWQCSHRHRWADDDYFAANSAGMPFRGRIWISR